MELFLQCFRYQCLQAFTPGPGAAGSVSGVERHTPTASFSSIDFEGIVGELQRRFYPPLVVLTDAGSYLPSNWRETIARTALPAPHSNATAPPHRHAVPRRAASFRRLKRLGAPVERVISVLTAVGCIAPDCLVRLGSPHKASRY